MAVNYEHIDYVNNVSVWVKNRDCYLGDKAIKDKGEDYLPKLSGHTTDEYESYKYRGLFVNYTRLTADGMIGQLLRKEPTIEGLNNIEITNIDGLGGTEYNLFRRGTRELIVPGRVGLFVDYYVTDAESIEEMESKGEKAYITTWRPESIINWKTAVLNGKNQLVLVVLKETISDYMKDEFEPEHQTIYKVLKLSNGIYIQEIWIEQENDITKEKEFVKQNTITPLLNGKTIDFIPFWIVNTFGIGTEVEPSAINDLCDVNISHYLNTCDNEHELFWCSVKTPVFPGHDPDAAIMIGKPVTCDGGKDSALPYILEAKSKSAISEEMVKKEQRMSAIGSSLITGRGRYIASAETSRIQANSETSILAHLSNVLSDAYSEVLTFWSKWNGYSQDVKVTFNKDFEEMQLDTRKAVELSTLVSTGFLSNKAYFYNMKKGEYYPHEWTYEDEQAEIEQDKENRMLEGGFNVPQDMQNTEETEEENETN